MKQEWEKILVDGKSCNGGKLTWSLPHKEGHKWVPGDWHTVDGDLEMCERGIHVTKRPFMWYRWGCKRYACEVRGTMPGGGDDKTLVRSARLLRPLPHPKWWLDAIQFVADIPKIRWFKPDGKPLKSWRLFEEDTLPAAYDSVIKAAGEDARNAAYRAAGSAAYCAAASAARGKSYRAAASAACNAAHNAARNAAHNAARNAACHAAYHVAYDASCVAYATAGAAAYNAARSAAYEIGDDAALEVVSRCVCAGTPLALRHQRHAAARWQVWQKGYCLLCDVDGVLYVYAQKR